MVTNFGIQKLKKFAIGALEIAFHVVKMSLHDLVKFENAICNTSCNWIRYDTRCYFNVRSKANNLPHGTDN